MNLNHLIFENYQNIKRQISFLLIPKAFLSKSWKNILKNYISYSLFTVKNNLRKNQKVIVINYIAKTFLNKLENLYIKINADLAVIL